MLARSVEVRLERGSSWRALKVHGAPRFAPWLFSSSPQVKPQLLAGQRQREAAQVTQGSYCVQSQQL